MMQSFTDLLKEARQMLLDRSKPEADLIYAIAALDDEARSAIILAYRNLFDKDWPNEDNNNE